MRSDNKKIIDIFADAAIKAGIYARDFRRNHDLDVSLKADKSPVTLADLEAHRILCAYLQQNLPDIPIISEEHIDHTIDVRQPFILIDPIDGTKSYIRGTNDYSINIALIEDARPRAAVIFVPEDGELFYASAKEGSYMYSLNDRQNIQTLSVRNSKENIILTVSSFSKHEINEQDYRLNYPISSVKLVGSAKKFTLIARGEADLYPRKGPTGEWDTAAGDLLVHEAGGIVQTLTGEKIRYGKKDFINKGFVALSQQDVLG
ncbi:MAG: 3'(2'),5'-bisphosphate nucleotidase CysQ [Pseudomonadota bacterium]